MLKKPLIIYDSCSTLPLFNFVQIVNTSNYKYLSSNHVVPKNPQEIWADIIMEYGRLDNNNEINNNFKNQIELKRLQNSYTTIKAMVRFLWMVTPGNKKFGENAKEIINDMQKMGYIINTTSLPEYQKSLINADKRCNSIVTLIKMKVNKMKNEVAEETSLNFDDIMAMLCLNSSSQINDDITVSRYVSIKKQIMQRGQNDIKWRQSQGKHT